MIHSFLFSASSISSNEQQTFEPLDELTCYIVWLMVSGIIGSVTESPGQFGLVETTLDWVLGLMCLGLRDAKVRCVTLEMSATFQRLRFPNNDDDRHSVTYGVSLLGSLTL